MNKLILVSVLCLISGCAAPKDGLNGSTGASGVKGDAGVGCSVSEVLAGIVAPNGGSLITCGNITTLVKNGSTGAQGADAPVSAFSIVSMVDPCGDTAGIYDEVLLRLADGTLLASFSDDAMGTHTRLSILEPGVYQTTDGGHCHFTIDNALEITNEYL